MSDIGRFFPPFLNKGSQGPAVRFLQSLLIVQGFNRESIIPDGDYGDQTAKGVRELQLSLGFVGADVDGNFGPKTRHAFLVKTSLDVDCILVNDFVGETIPGTNPAG